MQAIPFTIEQTREICDDFDDLIDTEIAVDGTAYDILLVAATPFEENEKKAFIDAYKRQGALLALPDTGNADYDVLIIAQQARNGADIITIPITEYIDDKGINYNYP